MWKRNHGLTPACCVDMIQLARALERRAVAAEALATTSAAVVTTGHALIEILVQQERDVRYGPISLSVLNSFYESLKSLEALTKQPAP